MDKPVVSGVPKTTFTQSTWVSSQLRPTRAAWWAYAAGSSEKKTKPSSEESTCWLPYALPFPWGEKHKKMRQHTWCFCPRKPYRDHTQGFYWMLIRYSTWHGHKFQSCRRKAGVQHKPHGLYKQFRHCKATRIIRKCSLEIENSLLSWVPEARHTGLSKRTVLSLLCFLFPGHQLTLKCDP